MSELSSFLGYLKDTGVEISIHNSNEIKYKYPKSAITKDITSKLKKHKSELLRYLSEIEKIESWNLEFAEPRNYASVKLKEHIIEDEEIDFYNELERLSYKHEMHSKDIMDIEKWKNLADKIAVAELLQMFRKRDIFHQNIKYDFSTIKNNTGIENVHMLEKALYILLKNNAIVANGREYISYCNNINLDDIEKKWETFKEIDFELNENNYFYNFFRQSMAHLEDLVNGDLNPLNVLFPQGDDKIAKNIYTDNIIVRQCNLFIADVVSSLIKNKNKKPFKIFEIGSGVGGTSINIIENIEKHEYKYYFTDISMFFLNNFKKEYKANENIQYDLFDINKPIEDQITANEKYDLIICANSLHNASDLDEAMRKLKSILNPDGIFIIMEYTNSNAFINTSLELNMNTVNVTDLRSGKNSALLDIDSWLNLFSKAKANIMYTFPNDKTSTGMSVFIGTFSDMFINKNLIETYFKVNHNVEKVVLEPHLRKTAKLDGSKKDESSHDTIEYSILKNIWEEIFNKSEIFDDDDFYLLGGDSLLLTQLISKTWDRIPSTKKWEWQKFVNMIDSNSIFKDLYIKIKNIEDEDLREMEYYHKDFNNNDNLGITRLNNHTNAYVFFHDGTGGLKNYEYIIKELEKLGSSYEIYGIAKDPKADPCKYSINGLASRYAELIYEQFNGYRKITLLGYCIGGSIAYETACILNNKYNIKTDDTIIIDSYLNTSLIIDNKENEYIKKCMENDYILSLLFSEILGEKLRISLSKSVISGYIEEGSNFDLEKAKKAINNPNLFNSPDFKKTFITMKNAFKEVSEYIPSFYKGRVTLIHGLNATENNFLESDEDFNSSIMNWQKYFGGEHRYYAINADHFTCKNIENSKTLASIIMGGSHG